MNEQLFVVEETMRKLRITKTVPPSNAADKKEEGEQNKPYKHPILSLAGIWTHEEAEEFRAILAEGDKIDYDEW